MSCRDRKLAAVQAVPSETVSSDWQHRGGWHTRLYHVPHSDWSTRRMFLRSVLAWHYVPDHTQRCNIKVTMSFYKDLPE